MKKFILFYLAYFLISISITTADIKLPSIFGSHMVIQQNTNVAIWGWADSGEIVTVKGNWMKNAVSVQTDKSGKWLLQIKSPKAGGPFQIIIAGKNKIVLNDVLTGEIWLASGQSNMSFPLKKSDNAENEIENANYPEIRLFQVERTYSVEPVMDCGGMWMKCSPESVKDFSAVEYFFGRKIYKELNVPVGLINSSRGNTPIEAWMDAKILKADPDLSSIFELWKKWGLEYSDSERVYNIKYEEWEKAKEALKTGIEEPKKPNSVNNIQKQFRRPGVLFNAMIVPLIPFTIRGIIWYQGENNIDRPILYRKAFPLLISDWRARWHLDDFPFYFVQIAPYDNIVNNNGASFLREAQMMTMSVPNTGMAVTVDIGNIHNIHPTDKKDVGNRLALWALAKTYGFKSIVYSGPIYKSMIIEGNKIRLYFDHIGSGLAKRGKELTQFEISGKNKKFYKAKAVIDGTTVVVHSDEVPNPVAVRYSWDITVVPNLFNKEGLPTAPFRTDSWKFN